MTQRTQPRAQAGAWLLLPLLCLLPLLLLAAPAQADFDQTFSFDADSLVLTDLIGAIQVQGHDGPNFEVAVHGRGRDASRDQLKLRTREGREAELAVEFPVKRTKKYVYPEMGRGSNTSISLPLEKQDGAGGLIEAIFEGLAGERVDVRGSGSGAEMWADVTVRVPRGKALKVVIGVGHIAASEARADLNLSTHSGRVELSALEGDLTVDTGSGRITGSNLHGKLHLDTGSGSVELASCAGPSVYVDTGSGSVHLSDVDTKNLHVDTGSGRVEATQVAADEANVDTGSGSVELELVRMGGGPYRVDTGSGSATLHLPATASATVHADSGSGGIKVELEGVEMLHKERDEVRFRVGSGEAKVEIDTGSGGIHILPTR